MSRKHSRDIHSVSAESRVAPDVAPTATGSPYMLGVLSVKVIVQSLVATTRDTRMLSAGATTAELLTMPHKALAVDTDAFTRAA